MTPDFRFLFFDIPGLEGRTPEQFRYWYFRGKNSANEKGRSISAPAIFLDSMDS
jgi:hypothetical protein